MKTVFETIGDEHQSIIKKLLQKTQPIYVIEPFTAFHHTKIRFFPSLLPDYAVQLIKEGKIHLITAKEIAAEEIYSYAADRAVEAIEHVYDSFFQKDKSLIEFVIKTLGSQVAEKIFQKILCEQLGEFYSINIIIQRIEAYFQNEDIRFYTGYNTTNYNLIQKRLDNCGQPVHFHPNIKFPHRQTRADLIKNYKRSITLYGLLAAQLFMSSLAHKKFQSVPSERKRYRYGIAINSPRQLRDIDNTLLFLVDDKKIKTEDIAFFQLYDFDAEDKQKISGIKDQVYNVPKPGKFFSNFREWLTVFSLSLRKRYFTNCGMIEGAAMGLFSYFRWKALMKHVDIQHFISSSDFGVSHYGRNIVFAQNGTQTWYFTDSINASVNFLGMFDGCKMRHPFWTYLYYDHFVTWTEFFCNYFSAHYALFKTKQIVGCLLTGRTAPNKNNVTTASDIGIERKTFRTLIAAFDSSYTYNSITSYEEAVAYAEDLLRLADEIPHIKIYLKEKKDRNFFKHRDPTNGPKLIECYERISTHKNMSAESSQVDLMDKDNKEIPIGSKKIDASELIAMADLVISFPFTTPTFEAISTNKPAVWHDPMGRYTHTPFSKLSGAMTHNYQELKETVLKFMRDEYCLAIDKNSNLIDPYRDGNAVSRFRDLLHNCMKEAS